MVESLPANSGDAGLISVLGRSHMRWSSQAHVSELLNPLPQLARLTNVDPTLHSERSRGSERPVQSNEDPMWPKIKPNKHK